MSLQKDSVGQTLTPNGPVPATSGGLVTIFSRDGPPVQGVLVGGTAVPVNR